MMGARRWTVLVALMVASAACGGGDDAGEATTTPAAVATTEAAATTGATAETPVTTAGAAASGEAATGTMVLLSDDFQDGDLDGWDVDSGWYVYGAGTEYLAAAGGAAWMWWPDGDDWPGAYVLRSSVRVDGGGLAVSIAVGDEGRYVLHLHEDGTDLLVDRPWGTFATLASGAPVALGSWHALAFGYDGSALQAYVDGEPLVAAEPADPLTGGAVGFGALDGSLAAFDNVLVTRLRAGLPAFPEEPTAPEPAAAAPPPVVEAPPEPEGNEPPEPAAGDPADLQLDVVAFMSSNIVTGDPVRVQFRVSNFGGSDSGPFQVAWEAMGSVCSASFASLAPGEAGTETCEAPGLPAGLYTWTAHADSEDQVVETNLVNNSLSGIIEVHVGAETRPDLDFVDGNPGTFEAQVPYSFWVIVDDLNGVGFDRAFTTRFLVDGQLICSVDKTGAPVQVFCDLPGMAAGVHVIEIQIDPENEIAESREDNNTWTWEVTIEGAGLLPDMVFYGLVEFHPIAGEPFEVRVITGDANDTGLTGTYEVWFYVNDVRECISTVTGGDRAEARCTYPGLAAGDYDFRFVIDGAETVPETNDGNNSMPWSQTVEP